MIEEALDRCLHRRDQLYAVFGVLPSLIIPAAAMTFSSVSVIGNALRLRQAKL